MWNKGVKHILILFFLPLFFGSCQGEKSILHSPTFRSWEQIELSDTLRVATLTSPTDFYIYRGQLFGIEYYKIRDFAKAKGLYLDIHLTNQPDSLLDWISNGIADVSITPIPKTKKHLAHYLFCGLEETHALVLAQAKGKAPLVHSITELRGQDVYAEKSSAAALRLQQIKEELGGNHNSINIHLVDSLSTESLLIELLIPHSPVKLVVADTKSAHLLAKHTMGLDVSTTISTPIRYSWVVHPANKSLAEQIDNHFSQEGLSEKYEYLKEYDASIAFFIQEQQTDQNGTQHIGKGSISAYDHIFKAEAERLGWHWTYLAAIAFQESRFTPDIIGWSGARGLMGIMPATGRAFGATKDELLRPEVSVAVAVDVLTALISSFQDYHPKEEQISFVLAAYNAGLGHVQDAQRLAHKYGASSRLWYGGVREYMLLKSNSVYYNDPVVKYGYVRGHETVSYVDNIMERQAAYRAVVE